MPPNAQATPVCGPRPTNVAAMSIKIALALGMSSTSNIAAAETYPLGTAAPGPAVGDQGEVSDDGRTLHRTLGQVAGLAYERGLTEDALDRIYAAQRDIIQAFGYPRPTY